MKTRSLEIDMCSGALMPKLLLFSLPLMLSGILQLFFNAADMVVIGRFSETEEIAELGLAAIGATASLTNFFINVIIGVSVGSNVMVARYFGAKRDRDVHDAVHTSLMLCIILGFAVGIAAIFLCRPILILMGTPEDVLPLAVRYIRIYFCGLPVIMLYNFGSAILRAVGDTRRPLFFLTVAGVVNVCLNLFFVIVLHMNVEGVALATVLSQGLSAFLVLRCLARSETSYRFRIRDLSVNRRIMKRILQIGLPAGLQGSLFSISNILIQSSVNFFGGTAMAGNTACQSLEGFVYTSMNSVYQASISFTSQNLGGGKYSRINRILLDCFLLVTAIGLIMGNLFYLFGTQLLGLYNENAGVVAYGLARMRIIMTTYCLCGIMEVVCGSLRGLGYGILPMIVSLLGACGLRIVWIYTYFQSHHTLEVLYLSYPISWAVTALVHLICFFIVRRHFPKESREKAA
ncbi:MAG: MATE family efflux transporter [Lachnospiraceae bacterium]|nr:MATE family efflux transporter [Lachnospiraceae bacterium]